MIRARTALGGAVTAPHHLAAESGAHVLREGGDAVEAMIAAAAVIAVVYPHMNSIGGDGFWLIAEPGAAPVGIRACGGAAAMATPDFYTSDGDKTIPSRGPRAALTVAGAVGGWGEAFAVSRELGGSLPFPRLLTDAVHYARDGVPATESFERLSTEKWAELNTQPGWREVYAPEGRPLRVGEIHRQPDLAGTLAQIAEAGVDDFYRGDLAARLAAGLEAVGSPLRAADLAAYRPKRVAPLSLSLNVGAVYNMPPPTQGVSSLGILGVFERLGVRSADGFDHVHGLIEATKRAFIHRNAMLGDPDRTPAALLESLGADALSADAAAIDRAAAAPWPHVATPGDTIWMGAVDRHGRTVSYIQSIFWEFGSGVVPAGSGVVWQNRGAGFALGPGPNELGPGRLPFHTLNPALARLKDGRTVAYGTMGGEGQPQTQAAVFTRAAMFDQDPQAAITAPRWLLGRTWGAASTNLKIEETADPALIAALRDAGHDVETAPAFHDMMGHAGWASISPTGIICAATDPRSDGAAALV